MVLHYDHKYSSAFLEIENTKEYFIISGFFLLTFFFKEGIGSIKYILLNKLVIKLAFFLKKKLKSKSLIFKQLILANYELNSSFLLQTKGNFSFGV